MISGTFRIILFVIVLTNLSGNEIELKEILKHANRLTRENNFESASIYFQKAMNITDSLKGLNKETDSLITSIRLHYENYKRVIDAVNHNLFEDRIYHFNINDIKKSIKDNCIYPEIEVSENEKVDHFINYYSQKANRTVQFYIENSKLYIDDIKKLLKIHGLDEKLCYLPIVESGYSAFAHSYAGATGIWQFIKSTGNIFGLKNDWWIDERRNPAKSTIAAISFLKLLYNDYKDWELALAAYNCGQGNVNRAIRKCRTRNFWKLWKLPGQTKNYVPRFMAIAKIMDNPVNYGFSTEKNENEILDTLQVDSCISLNLISELTEISYKNIKRYNPELKQWCLPPYAKNYPLTIPARVKLALRNKLRDTPDSLLFPVKNYAVRRGDNITKISRKELIKPAGIKDLNSPEKTRLLKEGDTIKVIELPKKEKWFTDFNSKYLSLYDNEPYYLIGRKHASYRVKKGDSVWRIARRFNVNHKKLKAWNRIGKKNYIFPGQMLKIYF